MVAPVVSGPLCVLGLLCILCMAWILSCVGRAAPAAGLGQVAEGGVDGFALFRRQPGHEIRQEAVGGYALIDQLEALEGKEGPFFFLGGGGCRRARPAPPPTRS